MNMALKASSINWCLLKKKSSWENYLIFIRADNSIPIWQKHCSLSNKTIRKGLERKMSRVDPLTTQVSLCYHFTYFCALTIWSIFILEKHNIISFICIKSIFICVHLHHFAVQACLHKGTHQIKIYCFGILSVLKKASEYKHDHSCSTSMQGKDLKPL